MAVFVLLLQVGSFAGPACPDVVEVRQPDGSSFSGKVKGDEFQGWVETDRGYTVIRRNETGYWEYAVPDSEKGGIMPSGDIVVPGLSEPSSLRKQLLPARDLERAESHSALLQEIFSNRSRHDPNQSSAASLGIWEPLPVSGSRKALMVLVNFSNRSFVTGAADWYNAMFLTGPGIKSVRQFFQDNSFSLLDVVPLAHTQPGNPTGVVTVTLSTAHPNYGGNITYAKEIPWLNEALAAAAPSVDFDSLDVNGDGVISPGEAVIYFIPAGYEASGSISTPSIWAHGWGETGVYAGTKTLSDWAVGNPPHTLISNSPLPA